MTGWSGRRICQGMIMALAGAAATSAVAQDRPGPLQLTVHPLNGGAYWVEGGRSNVGFVIGDHGVVAIDAEMTQEAVQREIEAIAKVTPKPLDQLIVTHADPDHVGGVPYYPASAAITMHENARSEVVASIADPNLPPMYADMYRALGRRLPNRAIGATETIVLDGVRMVLIYAGPAHTSGDLMVYLPTHRIVFAGDVVATNVGRFPIIHLGGSSLGWIDAMKTILALDARTYVGGHGAIETRAQLQARLRDAEDRREQIKAMVYAGKTLAEVEQALPDQPASPRFPSYTRTTYKELADGYPPASVPWLNLVK